MTNARARTNERGQRLVMGEFYPGIKTVDVRKERRDPWSVKIKLNPDRTVLGNLLGETSAFRLLAAYLTNAGGYLASEPCYCGRKGTLRCIVMARSREQYRSDGYTIFAPHNTHQGGAG